MTNASVIGQFVSDLKDSKWAFLRKLSAVYRAQAMLSLLEERASVSAAEAREFNSRSRDKWVADRARSVDPGSRVLDVGAGTAPYRNLFKHCKYETQDFAEYDGYKGAEGQYAQIDYVSDITDIPVPDASFDVILCTEVLEHVPRPIESLGEMIRIAKPGGRLFLTAPLGSGLHQEPYHFYGGYTDHWYRKFLTELGCEIISIEPNHGFFAHLAQECARSSWQFDRLNLDHGGYEEEFVRLIGDVLPRYFYELDKKILLKEFTIGFHVEAKRKQVNSQA
ncbi:class I SAM-dependent methyltransferase [Bradyrhizobium murdochi]|uniref:class I SAM-dependent methyltransferase n=1 Tax=Bradyrhizobium murdochi TaxID=1038859 RepID=UPI0006845AB2|nr:class I SAM-dependent methyltransferase [Bradyrhizobium murdochi]